MPDGKQTTAEKPVGDAASDRPLHRLAEVRRLQGIARRTMARRLNVEVMDIRRQENPATDVPLSLLYKWHKALGVPITELLVESEDGLSEALLRRAQLIRIMKTARAVHEQAEDEELRSMTQTLIDELIEIMPELREIAAWHTVGKRRGPRELGAAVGRGYVGEIYGDLE